MLPEDCFFAPSLRIVSLRFDYFFYLEVSLAGIVALSLTEVIMRVGGLY